MKIEFVDVSHIYDRKRQVYNLNEVNFSIPEGKNIAVLSAHVRSSTSLLNLISGIQHPTRGIVKREGIFTGVVDEATYFHRELSGEENIRFISKLYGQNSNQVINDVKEFASLGKELRQKTKNYAPPVRRKITIATALMMKADSYQLKSILNHPNQGFNKRIQNRLNDLAKSAKLIVASEKTNLITKYADTAIVINKQGHLQLFHDLQSGIEAHQALKKDA